MNLKPAHFEVSKTHIHTLNKCLRSSGEDNVWAERMPNPKRAQAKGRPFYVIQIKLWSDDVSGNHTKQWNKHFNWCWTHAGIPQRLQNQEYFIRFLSTSPHATPLEQSEAIQKMLSQAEDGFLAYDSVAREEIFCVIGILDLLGDNPMQSELGLLK